jgi:hypothetical protein
VKSVANVVCCRSLFRDEKTAQILWKPEIFLVEATDAYRSLLFVFADRFRSKIQGRVSAWWSEAVVVERFEELW